MSNRKTIQINPDLFSFSPKKRGRPPSPKNNGEKKTPALRPSSLKKKLIQRVKEHKLKENTKANKTSANIEQKQNGGNKYMEEFNDSIQYLNQLSSQRTQMSHKNNTPKQSTLKNHYSEHIEPQHVHLDLPENLQTVPPIPHIPENEPSIKLSPPVRNENIPYGCLKGGTKPTFKSWMKTQKRPPVLSNTTQGFKLTPDVSSIVHQPASTREQKLAELQNKIKHQQSSSINIPINEMNMVSQTPPDIVAEPPVMSTLHMNNMSTENTNQDMLLPKKTKKTTTTKYTLGKSKKRKTIGVLIKDRKTRKKILDAHRELKRKPISDVKQHLRDHGMIKAGSKAPNDILRKMYESSMLSGDIINQDSDVLMHNFLNDNDNNV